MSPPARKILIGGGGIGGLTAAIALRAEGLDAEVFEQADKLREIGAGLSVWPNATRTLSKLGLLAEVLRRSELMERLQLRTWRGEIISDLDVVSTFDAPSICIHRADMLAVLKEKLPSECTHLSHKLESFEADNEKVIARFSSGATAEGDALIGADGLHSTVRALVLGDGKPIYRGYHAWRGIAEFTLAAPRVSFESWGNGKRFGLGSIGNGRVYWYATTNAAQGTLGAPGRWKDELSQAFGDWHKPIPELIEATPREAILKHEMMDRPPARHWGTGRVTLLGDAAHPTTPNLGQGACLAIEDAVVLAKCLSGATDLTAALRQYEALRYRRTAFITRESRRLGWVGQLEHPAAVALRIFYFKLLPSFIIAARHRKYYAFEP